MKNLDFLQKQVHVVPQDTPMDEVEQKIKEVLERGGENEEIFDHVASCVPEEKQRSPGFIRLLMSLVCESVIYDSKAGEFPALPANIRLVFITSFLSSVL